MSFQKLYGAQPNGAFMFLAFLSLDRLIDRIEETPFPLQNGNTRRSYSDSRRENRGRYRNKFQGWPNRPTFSLLRNQKQIPQSLGFLGQNLAWRIMESRPKENSSRVSSSRRVRFVSPYRWVARPQTPLVLNRASGGEGAAPLLGRRPLHTGKQNLHPLPRSCPASLRRRDLPKKT